MFRYYVTASLNGKPQAYNFDASSEEEAELALARHCPQAIFIYARKI